MGKVRKVFGGAFWVLLLVAVVAAITCFTLVQLNGGKKEVADNAGTPEPEPEPEPVAVSAKARYMYAGTTFWGRRIYQFARKSDLGVKYPFSQLSTLKPDRYDAWIAGLECPITQKENNYHNYDREYGIYEFNCDPDYLTEAAKYFDVFGLGNNHSDNQGGATGLKETRKHLDDAGIQYFGTPRFTNDSSNRYYAQEKWRDEVDAKACAIVVLPMNVTYDNDETVEINMPFGFCSAHGMYGVPQDDIFDEMKTYAAVVPTIAMPHMGVEYQNVNDQLRKNLYHRMIDLGVEAVIADHPHHVQNAEAYKKKLIVYSMGNFMFDQLVAPERVRSAAIEANAEVEVKDVDFEAWNALGEICLEDKTTCFEKIKEANLPKISITWKYDYHATTSATSCITRLADTSYQTAVGQRLKWSSIPASMKVSK